MSPTTHQYVRLRNLRLTEPEDTAQGDDLQPTCTIRPRSKRLDSASRLKLLVFGISVALNGFLLLTVFASHSQHDRFLTYSPARIAVEHKRVVFSSAFGIEKSSFQGQPSNKTDSLWAGLYDFGISRISTEEARPMDNKTLPIPGDSGAYVIQLAVFHQLHCLNLLRKGIYGAVDMSNMDDLMGIEHLDHCVDMLRQSIMCSGDVTPITFSRTSLDADMKVVAEVVHTCRDFPRIQQWAWNRRLTSELDKTTLVIDDPLGWGTYTYSP